jgi:sporulation protein YlmC with PRC-barrel domain
MILSDILGKPAIDVNGKKLGVVIDARFVVDGTPKQLLAETRLFGLIVSPHSGSSFLGYERNGVTAPWPIGALLQRRHRDSFLVPWEDLAMLGSDAITLRRDFRQLSPDLPERHKD